MPLLRTKLMPTGQMQVSRMALIIGAIVVLVGVGLLALAQRALPSVGALLAQQEPEPTRKVEMPDVLKPSAQPYAELMQKPDPPVAQPVARQTPPSIAQSGTGPTPSQTEEMIKLLKQIAAKDAAPPPPAFGELWQQQQEVVRQAAQQQQTPQPLAGQGRPQESKKPAREPWIITPKDLTLTAPDRQAPAEDKERKERKEGPGQLGTAANLITPAVWAVPKWRERTLYRAQSLAGRTLDAINSDLPGQTRIELTVPVFGWMGRGIEVLPKGAIAITKQQGTPRYGTSRLEIAVEQIIVPATGVVIQFTAGVGDEQGANGVKGHVNNHYGKLVGAVAISAVLNFGVRSAAGTPGRGQHFEDPAQQAARDIGQDVQRTAEDVVKRELRVAPTITKPAGEFVSINLEKNVTFSRAPVVVR